MYDLFFAVSIVIASKKNREGMKGTEKKSKPSERETKMKKKTENWIVSFVSFVSFVTSRLECFVVRLVQFRTVSYRICFVVSYRLVSSSRVVSSVTFRPFSSVSSRLRLWGRGPTPPRYAGNYCGQNKPFPGRKTR